MRIGILILSFSALLLPASSRADECDQLAGRALLELAGVYDNMAPDRSDAARDVLLRLCRDARTSRMAESEAGAAVAEREARPPESTRLLGIEFEKAPPDAAGRSRTRKTP
jgi:hypothetical protein